MLAPDVLGVLFGACVLYGGATLVWVYVLRHVPLSAAYVFMSHRPVHEAADAVFSRFTVAGASTSSRDGPLLSP